MNDQTKLVTLEAWIAAHYDTQSAPSILTVRRWARDGNLHPRPQKQGRAYYVRPDARWIDPANPPSDLKPSGRPSSLLQKAQLA